jgi:hypothetical protein
MKDNNCRDSCDIPDRLNAPFGIPAEEVDVGLEPEEGRKKQRIRKHPSQGGERIWLHA